MPVSDQDVVTLIGTLAVLEGAARVAVLDDYVQNKVSQRFQWEGLLRSDSDLEDLGTAFGEMNQRLRTAREEYD